MTRDKINVNKNILQTVYGVDTYIMYSKIWFPYGCDKWPFWGLSFT